LPGELPEATAEAPAAPFEQPSFVAEPAEPVELPPSESAEAAPAAESEPAEETLAHDAEPALESETIEAAPIAEGGEAAPAEASVEDNGLDTSENGNGEDAAEEEAVESVGGADALEEVQERLPRFRRQYKIQEVIKRRQVMLVQVVKEERGTKGAALTTYLSLAGRYSVLMPNTARGGGISRKITSAEDRTRLKEIATELEVPEGMGVILRTAGASRTKAEVKRDFEYLLRLWEQVRDLTLNSTAPTLVYEEGSLVKRSIRDLYSKDIEEIIVAGEQGYTEARDFMRMLMPSHVKNVRNYKEPQPIFTRYGIESQLDAMFSPVVQLKSGGYIVINQAEALVAIDVNSGRATREHHIEDTALKTNGEAAEEIARQLRLRDLAGLIVIDFIDMDETRNNRSVERRLKDALKHDRARIQVGRISHFGLLEMSRQRIRTSVLESSTEKCPICGGSGHVRSVSSVALQALRALEETLIKGATHNLIVRTRSEVALYMLNHKRAHLRELEERFRVTLTVSADATVTGQQSFIIDRGELVHSIEAARALAQAAAAEMPVAEEEEEAHAEAEPEIEAEIDAGEPREAEGESREGGRRRRRRRGRGRGRGGEGREGAPQQFTHETMPEHAIAHEDHEAGSPEEEGFGAEPHAPHEEGAGEGGGEHGDGRRRRRRGRRGGRRNRGRGRNGEPFGPEQPYAAAGEAPPEAELEHAVEDMDRPSRHEEREPEAEHVSYPPERPSTPPTAEAEFPAPSSNVPPPEPAPRRRSTIREPAPIAAASMPAPAPSAPPAAAVISVTSSEEPAQPKRGWWAKKLLGDKS